MQQKLLQCQDCKNKDVGQWSSIGYLSAVLYFSLSSFRNNNYNNVIQQRLKTKRSSA